MSRRRWAVALPLGAGAAAVGLFLLGMAPRDSARIDSRSRPAGTAIRTAQTSAQSPATPSPTTSATNRTPSTATASSSGAATPTRSRTAATSSEAARVEAAPTIARVPVGGPGIQAAADYATSRGYRVGVAVLDTRTGKLWGASEHASLFASESVVKVFIATRLLLTKQMTGDVADTAFRMISRSDDGSADALHGYAGGDEVVTWIASHYGIANLGTPPIQAGWWSNTTSARPAWCSSTPR